MQTKFKVKWDFTQKQPKRLGWIGDLPTIFGERNEGVIVEASSSGDAAKMVAEAHRIDVSRLDVRAS